MGIETIKWVGGSDGYADMVDQTLLPVVYDRLAVRDVETMWDSIKRLVVRGAPAIGIAAGYGVVLATQDVGDDESADVGRTRATEACDYLATSRPTAVNLFWALDRMRKIATSSQYETAAQLKQGLLAEAEAIRSEDAAMCRAIGKNGATFISDGAAVLTHCNAGGLATAGYGTALALMFTAHEQGRRFSVFADETRPLLQGARLTSWELMQAGIDVTVICDNMAGHLMSLGRIDLVVVGADRIAANGDTANKIGTYSVAVLAQAHGVPFYVAAPSSTFDMTLPDGSGIPIEQRDAAEITDAWGRRTAPEGVHVYNPAFDVTPNRYISAIVTERGVIDNPDTESVAELLQGDS